MRGAIITEFARPVESFSAEKPGSVALLRLSQDLGTGRDAVVKHKASSWRAAWRVGRAARLIGS